MKELIEKHYKKNYDKLLKRFTKASGSLVDAEDIVQEGYSRALRYGSSFNLKGDLDKWLGTIMSNVLNDFKNDGKEGYREIHPDEIKSLEFSYDKKEFSNFIKDYCKNLREDHKEVIRLYTRFHYTPIEISKITNVSRGNVKVIVHRFRECAKEIIG